MFWVMGPAQYCQWAEMKGFNFLILNPKPSIMTTGRGTHCTTTHPYWRKQVEEHRIHYFHFVWTTPLIFYAISSQHQQCWKDKDQLTIVCVY